MSSGGDLWGGQDVQIQLLTSKPVHALCGFSVALAAWIYRPVVRRAEFVIRMRVFECRDIYRLCTCPENFLVSNYLQTRQKFFGMSEQLLVRLTK